MLKLYALSALFLFVGGSLYDFPPGCFRPTAIGSCASAQTSALWNGYRVNWATVDAARIIR
jgi:hypothetical protein